MLLLATLLSQLAFAVRAQTSQTLVDCIGSGLSIDRRLKFASNAKIPEDVVATLKKSKSGKITIDGFSASVKEWRQEGHDPGIGGYIQRNSGVPLFYRFMRNGKPRILKVLDDSNRSVSGRYDFDKVYQGLLWGQEAGGPKIYQAGRIKLPDGSTPYFYEMDEIFPGKPSATFKSSSRELGNEIHKKGATRSLALLFARALELHLAPTNADLDFVLSEGKASWLDTDYWEQINDGNFNDHALSGLQQVRSWLSGANSLHRNFEKSFVAAIKKSKRLSSKEKSQILAGLN
jgi:hypothetical protein